jgi:asparagine synthase (glutamine-hydrolysing)
VSGGLDSSGVLAAAVRARGAGAALPHVLTVDFAEPADDRSHLRALCEDVGIVPVRIPPRAFGGRLRSALVLDASPCTVPTASWMLDMVARTRDLGAERLLTGDGGDLVFEGDLSAIAVQASRGHLLSAMRSAAQLELPFARTRTARVMDVVVRPLLRRRTPRGLRARWRARGLVRARPWLSPLVAAWARTAFAEELARDEDPFGTQCDASWLERGGAARILDYGDLRSQVEHEAGALWHTPYLDPDLVDFVRRIPGERMFHNGLSRGLYREAMRGLMPETLRLRRTKAGIGEAVRATIDGAGGLAAFEDLLALKRTRSLGLVEPNALRAHLERGMAGELSNWTALWAPLAVEAFLAKERP